MVIATTAISLLASLPAHASFQSCVAGLSNAAKTYGISSQVRSQAFALVQPKLDAAKKAKSQPEFVKPIWQYLDSAVSPYRLKIGREKLQQHAPLFEALEVIYGVNRHVLTAVWGMESSFGSFQGKRNVIQSLVTLACYDQKRSKYARKQLNAALKIIQRGDISLQKMEGSWAGAMGQTQFIPTTYDAYAVDFDGDGKRNIWQTEADALGSAANYLRISGWTPQLPWGYEVKLPSGFNYSVVSRDSYRPASYWEKLGVKQINGKRLAYRDHELALIAPAGATGPAFILTKNFKAILRYNRSTAYALSIGHLADRLAGHAPFVAAWPTDNGPLTFSQRKMIQEGLKRAGLYSGKIDGIIGSGTQAAIKQYQARNGMQPDGYAGQKLLKKMSGS